MPLSATVLQRLPAGAAGSYSSATVVPLVAAALFGPEPPAIPESRGKVSFCAAPAVSSLTG